MVHISLKVYNFVGLRNFNTTIILTPDTYTKYILIIFTTFIHSILSHYNLFIANLIPKELYVTFKYQKAIILYIFNRQME